MNYEKTIKNIRTELYNYCKYNNIQTLVIGISGGMDSCLCAILARPVCDSLGIPLYGISLPITSNKQDEINRAKITGETFCTKFRQENLEELFHTFSIINPDPSYSYNALIEERFNLSEEELEKDWKIRNGNIKARLRMIYLYNLASMSKGMVLSTDNLTEYLLGFWTLHGDVGDYGMIQELYKSEVYNIAEWIANNESWWKLTIGKNIILDTMNALATDGLGVTNTGDIGQIMPNWKGSSREGYKEVDRILQVWMNMDYLGQTQQKAISPLKEHSVIQRHLKSAFKRDNPHNLKRFTIIVE